MAEREPNASQDETTQTSEAPKLAQEGETPEAPDTTSDPSTSGEATPPPAVPDTSAAPNSAGLSESPRAAAGPDEEMKPASFVGSHGPGESLEPKPLEQDPQADREADELGQGEPPSLQDPIEAAAGRSLKLKSVYNFRWPNYVSYLSVNIRLLLYDTILRFAPESETAFELTADHLVATLIAEDAPVDRMFIGQLRLWARETKTGFRADVPARRTLISPDARVDRELVLLRWDVVEVLAEASRIRHFINPGQDEIGTRHLAIALLRTPSGQAALRTAKLIDRDLRELADTFGSLLRGSDFVEFGDRREAWLEVARDLLKQQLLISLSVETPASYDADRPQRLVTDSLGVREDAAALANLILLESAKPPIAIGLFGAWGSGKSTLIKELQHRIHEDLKQENALVKAGLNDTKKETRRVRNVVQIEFNAWAYADSANLWASLTSEIFDQLAAGGIRPEGERTGSDRRYAEVVRDVKLLNSRDANALRSSDVEIAELEQKMGMAHETLRSAKEARRTAIGEAIAVTAQELLQPASEGGPDQVYLRLGEPAREPDKSALEVMRRALSAGDNPEARIKAYTESGGDILRLLRITWDLAKSRWWTLAVLAIALIAFAAAFVLFPAWLAPMSTVGTRTLIWLRWLGATVGAAGIASVLAGLWPAIRVAALIRRELKKRVADAKQAEADARDRLTELGARLDAVRAGRSDAETRMKKFGALADGASVASPERMLEYLLSDSADVEALRQQQGLVARVRRCFEQLNSVINEMQKEPKAEGAIDRVILYIDDLDRCDAAQVSNVLQAVHLLLAFDYFIVVVAVDARWLKRSLETHHVQLKHAPPTPLDQREPAAADDPLDVAEPPPASGAGWLETDDEPPATAADYLEKIFQIPLWVRPLVDDDAPAETRYAGYENFIGSIAGPAEQQSAPAGATSGPADGGETGPPAAEASGANEFAWGGSIRPEQADKPRREGLQLTDAEIEIMKAMGPLAAKSPRAVKRMVNLYRLLRVRYRDEKLTAFLDGGMDGVPNYRELLFALACENGLTGATRRKLRAHFASRDDHKRIPWPFTALEALATPAECRLIAKIKPKLGALTEAGMYTALEEVRRYSFLP